MRNTDVPADSGWIPVNLKRWELELETVLEDRFMGVVVTDSLFCAAAKEGETVLNVSMSFFSFIFKIYLFLNFVLFIVQLLSPAQATLWVFLILYLLPCLQEAVPTPQPPPQSDIPTPKGPQFSQGLGATSLTEARPGRQSSVVCVSGASCELLYAGIFSEQWVKKLTHKIKSHEQVPQQAIM